MRYERMMKHGTETAGPARLLAVSCDVSKVAVSSESGCTALHLTRWVARLIPCRTSQGTATVLYTGVDAKAFIPVLTRLFDQRGTTLIVCDPAIREIALLGIWELLERKIVTLSDRQLSVTGEPIGKSSGDGSVACVLEDPPVILSLAMPGACGRVKVIDLANYGMGDIDIRKPASERASLIEERLHGMIRILTRNNWGGLRLTASSQASGIWKTRYHTHTPFIHTKEEVLELERAACRGGRGECWSVGRVDGPLYQLDVSGMYSHIASELTLPFCLYEYHEHCKEDMLLGEDNSCLGIARVTVRTDKPIYPWIPTEGGPLSSLGEQRTYHRTEDGTTKVMRESAQSYDHGGPGYAADGTRQVIYPVGTFTTVLAGSELIHAFDSGHIVRWHDGVSYTMAPFLQSFMCAMHAERMRCEWNGEDIGAKFVKRMANSLVGRMARTEHSWSECVGYIAAEPWGEDWIDGEDGEIQRVRIIGWRPEVELCGGFAEDAVPAAYAFITAAGRLRLWRLCCIAGLENVHYVQTDELWVNGAGYCRLLESGEVAKGIWGKLSVKKQHAWAVFDGVNTYHTDCVRVNAGIPKTATGSLIGHVRYTVQESPMASAADGRRPQAVQSERVLQSAVPYTHGVVLVNGRVEPWRIGEI